MQKRVAHSLNDSQGKGRALRSTMKTSCAIIERVCKRTKRPGGEGGEPLMNPLSREALLVAGQGRDQGWGAARERAGT